MDHIAGLIAEAGLSLQEIVEYEIGDIEEVVESFEFMLDNPLLEGVRRNTLIIILGATIALKENEQRTEH